MILVKEGSLGFSIIGGTDHSCTPFGAKEPGIFISHVSFFFNINFFFFNIENLYNIQILLCVY